MKINILNIEQGIEWKSGARVLEIQNKRMFRKILEDFLDDYTSRNLNNTVVVLDGDNKRVKASKDVLVVTDVYGYDLAGRSLTSALYKSLQKHNYIDKQKFSVIENDILRLMGDLDDNSPFHLQYSDSVDFGAIIKMMHVVLEASAKTCYLDKLYAIIETGQSLLNKELIVLVNVSQFLTHNEWQNLNSFINNLNVSVLFFESRCEFDAPQKTILDEDLYSYNVSVT